MEPAKMEQYKKQHLPAYTEAELAQLRSKYTPEQMEAIEAGEKAIDAADLVIQGRLRDDPYRPTYVEDYSKLDPRYDLKPQPEGQPREHKWLDGQAWLDDFSVRLARNSNRKTDTQLTRAMARALRRVKEAKGADMIDLTEEDLTELERDPEALKKYLVTEDAEARVREDAEADPDSLMTEAQVQKLDEAIEDEWRRELQRLAGDDASSAELRPTGVELMADGPAGALRAGSVEAAELGKVPGVEGRYKLAADPADQGRDEQGEWQDIKRLTGLPLGDLQSLYVKTLVRRSVANQTRMGKVRSSSIVAIAGNGQGRLGIGMAKSTDAQTAGITAHMLAIRNMKAIRRYEDRTIYGDSKAKVGGTIVELFNRPPGTFRQLTLATP